MLLRPSRPGSPCCAPRPSGAWGHARASGATAFACARGSLLTLVLLASLSLGLGPARAERADRDQPMVVEADRSGTLDLQRQLLVYTGNVVITQGSMVLRADRVELRETADGYRTARATGAQGRPASWQQRREGLDETVSGTADRIEYDGRSDTVRLIGNSAVRRLRGAVLADEITGAEILWDNSAEVFRVDGAPASAAGPGGRVRAVLSPRTTAPAPAPPAANKPPGDKR